MRRWYRDHVDSGPMRRVEHGGSCAMGQVEGMSPITRLWLAMFYGAVHDSTASGKTKEIRLDERDEAREWLRTVGCEHLSMGRESKYAEWLARAEDIWARLDAGKIGRRRAQNMLGIFPDTHP